LSGDLGKKYSSGTVKLDLPHSFGDQLPKWVICNFFTILTIVACEEFHGTTVADLVISEEKETEFNISLWTF
jgi:hypothetical protein